MFASTACSKTTDADAAATDTKEGAAATDATTGDVRTASPTAAPTAAPSPLGHPAVAASAVTFPTKEELTTIVEQVKVFEVQSKNGTLKPEELEAFMAASKGKFPPGVEPPRELIESDAQFQASQEELIGLMKSLNPQDMQSPEKKKEIEAKMAPITLKLMRRTFEILIENNWQPPAPGAAPAPAPAPGAAPAAVPAPAPAAAPAKK